MEEQSAWKTDPVRLLFTLHALSDSVLANLTQSLPLPPALPFSQSFFLSLWIIFTSPLSAVGHISDPVWEVTRGSVLRGPLHLLVPICAVCHRAFPLQDPSGLQPGENTPQPSNVFHRLLCLVPFPLPLAPLTISYGFVSQIFTYQYSLVLHSIFYSCHVFLVLFTPLPLIPLSAPDIKEYFISWPPPLHLPQELVRCFQWVFKRSSQGTAKQRGNSGPVVSSILISPLVLHSSPTELQRTENKPCRQQDKTVHGWREDRNA